MLRTISTRLASWIILVSLAVVLGAVEQSATAAEGPAPVKKILGRKGRRLPAHYAQVVDEQQREKIYKIQEEYQPKIDALQKQIDALKKERDDKISALLTADQKKQVEEAKTKIKATRKSKDRSATKPADATPATPPVTAPPSPAAPTPEK
jgi:hypothetical protein